MKRKCTDHHLQEDQREMRSAFLRGFAGQLVSGVIWIISALIGSLGSQSAAMIFLFFGCSLIFPLTQLTLRIMGRPAKVKEDNGLWALGAQIAFTVPVNFLLVGALTIYREPWFYPAAMIIVGAHYLPFVTLYGMKMYGVLGGILILGGAGLGLYGPEIFSLGGWMTGVTLIIFAILGRKQVLSEEREASEKRIENII